MAKEKAKGAKGSAAGSRSGSGSPGGRRTATPAAPPASRGSAGASVRTAASPAAGARTAAAGPERKGAHPPFVERRREPRAPINIRIDYQTVDAFFSEFASNINQGGLYIKTHKPLPPGTQLNIQFLLPSNSRPIQVVGEVVWVNEKTTKGINPGMGIKFGELDADAKAQINELVRSLRVS